MADLIIPQDEQNANRFPVILDSVLKDLGYSRRDNAKRYLVNNFRKDVDYVFSHEKRNGRDFIAIQITTACFERLKIQKTDLSGTPLKAEARIRDRIAEIESGETEVITPAGRIDVLTSTQLIEIKQWNRWKSAIGQVEVYGDYYPSHQKRIHFFGSCHSSFIDIVLSHCNKRSIAITWENNNRSC